ncbi:ankyrin repeat, PH and SEC7 domain containing protein secG-like [Sitodiplosis mosellana]|uniref:ankyrin repeat, PH and SEC7 domain containing protein secG-like n=1 Tax=Sitodiplosis mosellana TaxID=263140 RepID=UPI0024447412|nr:ankyrin repeat, PH and SEC7 domain containing protein secG-like [Sitodiplosis mosellana]XP_055308871.1 ankyrin repeat, PH and SEC7 domain containing protein secG-like [Sitodiplosis mosellana]
MKLFFIFAFCSAFATLPISAEQTPNGSSDRGEAVMALLRKLFKSGNVTAVKEELIKIAQTCSDSETPLSLAILSENKTIVNALLNENGTGIDDVIGINKCTILYRAIVLKNQETVDLLIEKGANVSAINKNHRRPLHQAASKGDVKIVQSLMKKYVDVNAKDYKKQTPLHLAASSGHKDVADELLKNKTTDIEAVDNDGKTPLYLAAESGQTDMVKFLVREKKANVNITSRDLKRTPLHTVCLKKYLNGKSSLGIATILVEDGHAEVDAEDNEKFTPLQFASQSGADDIVKFLIRKGADVTHKNKDGYTPIHTAAENGHNSTIALLIEKSADKVSVNVNDKSVLDVTPLHLAAQNGFLQVVVLLLQNKAIVDAKEKHNWTALHFAAINGFKDIVDILIKAGASVDAQQEDGYTPLHLVAQHFGKDHLEVARRLIEANATTDAKENKYGSTPLHIAIGKFAIKNVYQDMVDLLIKNTDRNVKNNKGETPYCSAKALNSPIAENFETILASFSQSCDSETASS